MTNEQKFKELKSTMTDEEFKEASEIANRLGRTAWMLLRNGDAIPRNRPWAKLTEAEQFYFGAAVQGILAAEKARELGSLTQALRPTPTFPTLTKFDLESSGSFDRPPSFSAGNGDLMQPIPPGTPYSFGIQRDDGPPFDPASILP